MKRHIARNSTSLDIVLGSAQCVLFQTYFGDHEAVCDWVYKEWICIKAGGTTLCHCVAHWWKPADLFFGARLIESKVQSRWNLQDAPTSCDRWLTARSLLAWASDERFRPRTEWMGNQDQTEQLRCNSVVVTAIACNSNFRVLSEHIKWKLDILWHYTLWRHLQFCHFSSDKSFCIRKRTQLLVAVSRGSSLYLDWGVVKAPVKMQLHP